MLSQQRWKKCLVVVIALFAVCVVAPTSDAAVLKRWGPSGKYFGRRAGRMDQSRGRTSNRFPNPRRGVSTVYRSSYPAHQVVRHAPATRVVKSVTVPVVQSAARQPIEAPTPSIELTQN